MNKPVTLLIIGAGGRIVSGPDETLESHRMVFAAERARREDRVVHLNEAGPR